MRVRSDGVYKTVVLGISMIVLGFCKTTVLTAAEKEPQLCQGNFHSEEAAKKQLAKFAASYSNLAE